MGFAAETEHYLFSFFFAWLSTFSRQLIRVKEKQIESEAREGTSHRITISSINPTFTFFFVFCSLLHLLFVRLSRISPLVSLYPFLLLLLPLSHTLSSTDPRFPPPLFPFSFSQQNSSKWSKVKRNSRRIKHLSVRRVINVSTP